MAWRNPWIVPIPGTTQMAHMENIEQRYGLTADLSSSTRNYRVFRLRVCPAQTVLNFSNVEAREDACAYKTY